jgi:hypothetical protein
MKAKILNTITSNKVKVSDVNQKKYFAIMKMTLITLVISTTLVNCSKIEISQKKVNCLPYERMIENVTISRGVYGNVLFTEGNCMPLIIDTTPPNGLQCRTYPVVRKVRIYKYTQQKDAIQPPSSMSGEFYSRFRTLLVAEIETDICGFFQISLPQGKYSMAVVENGLLYANGSDSQGGIHPFTVGNGVIRTDLNITYKAIY